MRSEYTQSPSVQELARTMEREVKRAIPDAKKNVHFGSVAPLEDFLAKIGYFPATLDLGLSWQKALVRGEEMVKEIIPLILSKDSEDIAPAAIELYRYLAEEDKLEKADVIVVYGAKTPLRAEKAVELYKQGLAPRVLFSGKGPTFVEDVEETEAEKYKKIALAAGVPEESIIVEPEAITLPDNACRSLNLLEELQIPYKNTIIVCSPYAQRRAAGFFLKYSPEGTKVYRVNCSTKESLREDQWFKNEEGIKYVLGEYGKIWLSLITNRI